MKIHSEQHVEAVKQEQAKARQAKEAAQGFGDLLNQEVAKNGEGAAKAVAPSLGGLNALNPLLAAQQTASAGQSDQEAVIDTVENVLNRWDAYTSKLGSSSGNMKSAYGELEAISDEMRTLRDNYPGLSEKSPGLQSIVDELNVLAATEKIKFNRGDYL